MRTDAQSFPLLSDLPNDSVRLVHSSAELSRGAGGAEFSTQIYAVAWIWAPTSQLTVQHANLLTPNNLRLMWRIVFKQVWKHNALHARFEGKRNKGRPKIRRILENVDKDIESNGLTLRRAMDLTKDQGQWRSFIRTHGRQMASIRNWWY